MRTGVDSVPRPVKPPKFPYRRLTGSYPETGFPEVGRIGNDKSTSRPRLPARQSKYLRCSSRIKTHARKQIAKAWLTS
jgi:hypothetical protein